MAKPPRHTSYRSHSATASARVAGVERPRAPSEAAQCSVRVSGSQNAASSFSLNSGNGDPKDIMTDGVNFWVVTTPQPPRACWPKAFDHRSLGQRPRRSTTLVHRPQRRAANPDGVVPFRKHALEPAQPFQGRIVVGIPFQGRPTAAANPSLCGTTASRYPPAFTTFPVLM
jgi:hypothetical protein